MNDNEADRIAAMANALRPDWPLSSLRTLLARPEIARRSRRDVAVALAWVACETETKTPARVLEAGPWWRAANVEGETPRSYDVACPIHPGETVPCGRCAHATAPSGVAGMHLKQARAELAAARGRCCSHGVNRAVVRCADCERPKTETTEIETEGSADE